MRNPTEEGDAFYDIELPPAAHAYLAVFDAYLAHGRRDRDRYDLLLDLKQACLHDLIRRGRATE